MVHNNFDFPPIWRQFSIHLASESLLALSAPVLCLIQLFIRIEASAVLYIPAKGLCHWVVTRSLATSELIMGSAHFLPPHHRQHQHQHQHHKLFCSSPSQTQQQTCTLEVAWCELCSCMICWRLSPSSVPFRLSAWPFTCRKPSCVQWHHAKVLAPLVKNLCWCEQL